MVSNQQDLHQVGIDEFLRALRSLGDKKDDISGEPLKIKYSSVALFGAHTLQSTPAKYEHEKKKEEEEGDDKEKVVPPSPKRCVHNAKKKHHSKLERDMFTNRPDASLLFYMFINLLNTSIH